MLFKNNITYEALYNQNAILCKNKICEITTIDKIKDHQVSFKTTLQPCHYLQLVEKIRTSQLCVTNFAMLKKEFESNFKGAYSIATTGIFTYNPKEFCCDKDGFLTYIGSETDGSKIKIPEGIKFCDFMFAKNTKLVKAPKLPISATSCFGMFMNCLSLLEAPEITENVAECSNMFEGCIALKKAPSVLPSNVKKGHGMFAACYSLTNAPEFTEGIWDSSEMFSHCTSLKSIPRLPNSITRFYGMFSLCSQTIQAAGAFMLTVVRSASFELAKSRALNADGTPVDLEKKYGAETLIKSK